MSLLSVQVAGLLHTYQPPVPQHAGRVHRCDDDEIDTNEPPRVCATCHVEKPAHEFYTRSDGKNSGDCKDCYLAKDRARRRKAKK